MRYNSTLRLLLAGLLFWLSGPALLRAQTLDPTFQPTVLKTALTAGIQQGVNALAVQPDGKVLVAGGFDFVNGTLTGKLQRLNPDGTTDAAFNAGGMGANAFLSAVLLQPDGKIVVGGSFTTFNGQALSMLVRLNADGSLDPGFSFGSAASIRQIGGLALQPDGKILVGSAASLSGTAQTGGLVRLNPNGALDPTFTVGAGLNPALGGIVSAILVQSDGKIVIGGSFTFNSQPYLARLTSTGAPDPGFSAVVDGPVAALAQQPDGKLVLGGSFFRLNGVQPVGSGYLGRVLPDGTTDATFQLGLGLNSSVRSIMVQPSGSILIAGNFTQVDATPRGRVARLSPTGSLDTNFATGAGANATVNAVAVAPTGQVLVGGGFTQYDGAPTAGVARLSAATGQPDAAFAPVVEPRGILNQAVPLPNGQLLVTGNFTQFNGAAAPGVSNSVRRINANGTLDASFSTPLGGYVRALQPNGSFYLTSSPFAPNPALRRVTAAGTVDNAFTALAFGPTSGVNVAILQGAEGLPNGQLLAFGRFSSYGPVTGLSGLVRLNADGSVDNTFGPVAGSASRRVLQVLVQPGGKLVVVYDDLTVSPNPEIVRLNANGTADNTFSVGTGGGTSAYSVLLQPDGRLLVSGTFTSFNGQPAPYNLVRLTANGAVDPTYSGLADVYYPRTVQPDGRLLAIRGAREAGALVRLNLDGSLDAGFAPVATPQSIFTGDDVVTGAVLQPTDGKIVLYGSFRYIAGQVRIGLARLANVGLATRAALAVQPLALYPNPAQTAVTIELPAAAAARPATLLDLNGRPVRRWTVPARQAAAQLTLDAVPVGIYLLQVLGENAVYQQKVVVAP